MSYIKLSSDCFQAEDGFVSQDFISHYCEITQANFEYLGYLDGYVYDNFIFKNIVYCHSMDSGNIVNQFPDLHYAGFVRYWIISNEPPDIGNLIRVNKFRITFDNEFSSSEEELEYLKKYVEVIDHNTLIINNKKLIVTSEWSVGSISYHNFL